MDYANERGLVVMETGSQHQRPMIDASPSASFGRGGVGRTTAPGHDTSRLVDLFELSQSLPLDQGVVHLQGQEDIQVIVCQNDYKQNQLSRKRQKKKR